MYVRVTHYRMKPESINAATELLNEMKSKIMALPGLKQFINSINSDGTGVVVSVMESQQVAEANNPAVEQIWAQYSEFLMAPPEGNGFEVIANWNN